MCVREESAQKDKHRALQIRVYVCVPTAQLQLKNGRTFEVQGCKRKNTKEECDLSMEGACEKRLVKQAGGQCKESKEKRYQANKRAQHQRALSISFMDWAYSVYVFFKSFLFLPCPLPRCSASTSLP